MRVGEPRTWTPANQEYALDLGDSDTPEGSSSAARAAVERLNKIRQSSNFVDVFVDEQKAEEVAAAKLLISGAGDGDRTRDIQLGKLAFYR